MSTEGCPAQGVGAQAAPVPSGQLHAAGAAQRGARHPAHGLDSPEGAALPEGSPEERAFRAQLDLAVRRPDDLEATPSDADFARLVALGRAFGGASLCGLLPSPLQRRWRRRFGCGECGGSRRVRCPTCNGRGGYEAMGGVPVACKSCRSTGRVVCRACFVGDGFDIDAIRRDMGVPD
ncbi:hypothetical protein EMIHUDRAFT_456668 [Emiliania huxleyi CCMP1516]|uniref:Uncharacterized protein n=2 Tax=Emiliania huxleyi TaxID=2903 RepID=A0A0D3K2E6_EMIH1|nr:hypothetical protein EMIHUDRAFT_456668 [Emiliania huxleyi CCMP1516]EOD29931.1 hypothetical protein EMIHUDRAFT_456668 [Emiliania huxleyi CCMP1516]|eukprot:XP_005782360.1 hypothetical protein EMIHUDRAFT_456668 [Emiliania huxleyi CCMP1516]